MADAYREMYSLNEDNMDLMRKAAKGAMQTIKFKDGKLKMDSFTASGIMAVYDKINPKNKESMEKMINHGNKSQIMRLQALAMKNVKGRKEEVEIDEAKSSTGYELYHKTFSGAMQHAYAHAKKKFGITVNPNEIDDKVATGPAKPSKGKTNKYGLKGDKGGIQVQVYNSGKNFELNMYKEEVVKEGTWQLPQGNQAIKGLKRLLTKPIELGKMAQNAKNTIDKYLGDDELFDDLEDAADKNPKGDAVPLIKKAMVRLNIKEELSLDEGKMSQMHQMIKDKKTPAQIAKAMGLDLKTVKALMASYEQMVPESFEIGTEKYLKHTVETTPGQKEWKETVSKKAASMRETLAKMWKVDEGKNVFAKDEKKDLTSEVKGGKTMTGKKVAEIDTKPTIKEKKK